MFYISNVCCLCLKTSCDLYKNLCDYDDANITLHEKLSLLPTLFQLLEDNKYKICPDCYIVIKNICDFSSNSIRCLNIFQTYLQTVKGSKINYHYQLSVKLRDIGEGVDSWKNRNEGQTTTFEDIESFSEIKEETYCDNETYCDSDNGIKSSVSFDDVAENREEAVKTEMEVDDYIVTEGESNEQQQVIERDEANMMSDSSYGEYYMLEGQDQEIKIEVVESEMKAECFPEISSDSKSADSPSASQGTFTCNYCKRSFTTSVHCQKHIRRCRYKVYNQPSTSTTSIPDKKPRLTNDGEKLFQCDKCDKKYKSQMGLYLHLRRHSGVGLHTCRECRKQFPLPSQLAKHLLIHTGEKPHKCTQCDAAFNTVNNLKTHMLTHTGARPHKCTQCGQSFSQSGSLITHKRTHMGERPYQCTQCNKAFTDSSNLTRHMRTHTGERPYQCTHCSKEFTDSSNLTVHMRTHSGHKPYRCKVCSQAFAHSNSLKCHMKTHSKKTSNKP